MTKQITDATGWYGHVFKGWRVADLGPKPTADQLANIHNLGARPGKQALAIAMALRDEGVTGAQIVMACGAPQLNKMRGYITDGLLKRQPHEPDAKGHQVYKLEVTAKGTKRIDTNVKRAADAAAKAAEGGDVAKPAKGKAKPKKRTSKAAKATEAHVTEADTATIDTVPVPSPVEPQQVTA